MTIKKTDLIDYRKFRLSKLGTPEFEHVKLLAFWPVYGLAFLTVERLWIRDSYTPISCALDSAIPFCELFLIPYLFWFVFLTGTLIYTFLCDAESFTRMMKFIIISYTAAIAVYILFPNCQELRPPEFARDNILTRFIARFYEFDTNTNVCPSIHVIGSVAAVCGAWDSKHFSSPGWRASFALSAFLISVSTVFIKQHSVLDLLAAVPLCLIAWPLARARGRANETNRQRAAF